MNPFDDQPWLSLWDSSDQAPNPHQARREAWALYMASREWAILRQQVIARCGRQCERCKLYPFDQVHHRLYLRRFHERLEDVWGLCALCHAYLSGKIHTDPRGQRALENLTDDLNVA